MLGKNTFFSRCSSRCLMVRHGETVRSLVYEFGCQRTVVLTETFLGGLGLLLVVAAAGEQVRDAGCVQTHTVCGLKNLVAVLDFVK